MYIHVHVVMYLYVHGINMSVPCSDIYVKFCPIRVLSRWVDSRCWIQSDLLVISSSRRAHTPTTLSHACTTTPLPLLPAQQRLHTCATTLQPTPP